MASGAKMRAAELMHVRQTVVGVAAVSGLSIAASAIGFMFQVVLAAHFGAGSVIDGYLFAISAPTFLAAIGATALSYTAMPMLVDAEQHPGKRAALLRALLKRMGLVSVGFAAIGGPAIVIQRLLLPSSADLRLVAALPMMIALGWAIGGAQLFSALFTVELNAARRPIVAALLSLPTNLGAIMVVLLAPHTILAAPAGVLAGSLATVIFGIVLTWRSFLKPAPHEMAATSRIGVRAGVGRVGWTLLAMSCFSAYGVIDAFWAPRAGVGTLASLGYAQRLIVGIGSLIIAGPSAILTPRFAARLRDGGEAPFLREVALTVFVVAGSGCVAAALLALFAGQLIGLAFARGAFDAADITRVSVVFRSMLPGFCAMLISVVLTRAIYCLKSIERPMAMAGLGWSATYFIACGTLLPLGGIGFGISYSLAWFGYMIVTILILRRYANAAQAG